MRENQHTVAAWTKATFPHRNDMAGRIHALLEEATELAIAACMRPSDIVNTVTLTIEKSKATESSIPEESADVQLCLYAIASTGFFDLAAQVDEKMEINRARPQSYYDQKTAAKKAIGLA